MSLAATPRSPGAPSQMNASCRFRVSALPRLNVYLCVRYWLVVAVGTANAVSVIPAGITKYCRPSIM